MYELPPKPHIGQLLSELLTPPRPHIGQLLNSMNGNSSMSMPFCLSHLIFAHISSVMRSLWIPFGSTLMRSFCNQIPISSPKLGGSLSPMQFLLEAPWYQLDHFSHSAPFVLDNSSYLWGDIIGGPYFNTRGRQFLMVFWELSDVDAKIGRFGGGTYLLFLHAI